MSKVNVLCFPSQTQAYVFLVVSRHWCSLSIAVLVHSYSALPVKYVIPDSIWMLVMYNISLVTKIFLPAVSFNDNNCKLRVSLSFLVWISVIKKKKRERKANRNSAYWKAFSSSLLNKYRYNLVREPIPRSILFEGYPSIITFLQLTGSSGKRFFSPNKRAHFYFFFFLLNEAVFLFFRNLRKVSTSLSFKFFSNRIIVQASIVIFIACL